MADNVTANAGSGGAVFAADDISSVFYPRTKITIGADGVTDGDVSSANPLPVTNAGLTELAAAINGSSQMDVNIAASAATVAVSNAGLTELAAAINVSSQMDVNIAASGATVPISNAGITTVAGAVSGTEMQVDVVAALPAGTNAIGKLAANSGVDIGDVDVTSISAGTNTIGGVTPRPETTGGLSIARDIDLDNSALTVVKGSAGQLYGWSITNTTTATVFVKFYDAASGTYGTGTPVMTIGIPGNATDDTLAMQSFGGMGIVFATGISVGAGTGVADADTADPGANGVVANIYYK